MRHSRRRSEKSMPDPEIAYETKRRAGELLAALTVSVLLILIALSNSIINGRGIHSPGWWMCMVAVLIIIFVGWRIRKFRGRL